MAAGRLFQEETPKYRVGRNVLVGHVSRCVYMAKTNKQTKNTKQINKTEISLAMSRIPKYKDVFSSRTTAATSSSIQKKKRQNVQQ